MQFSRVLVAVDGSETSDKVFDAAAQLVKLSGGRLFIIHVVAIPIGAAESLFAVDAEGMNKLSSDLEKRGKVLLEKYAAKAEKEYKINAAPSSSSSVETILAQGNPPAEAIIKEAESNSIDLIVVGSRGFGGAKEFFIGSVPNSVLHHSKISVLLVK